MIDITEIRKLSVDERLEMVEAIWDSIAEDTTPSDLKISTKEKEEVLRRYEEYKSGEQSTYSWEDVVMYAKEP
ncbi:MAG: addiction module protein [Bacteroidetes bacterium]|nr:addiction module protein [Bacteroidota bacterium]